MKGALLAVLLAPSSTGCVFITQSEHDSRLGLQRETGDTQGTQDTQETAVETVTQAFSGTFGLDLELRESAARCEGALAVELSWVGGAETPFFAGEGSCSLSAEQEPDLDGLPIALTLSGAVDASCVAGGVVGIFVDEDPSGNPEDGSWEGQLDDVTGVMSGTLSASTNLRGQGSTRVSGTWEVTRQEEL